MRRLLLVSDHCVHLNTMIMTTTEKQFQITLLVTRVIVGIVVLGHGVQKLFGWFGGYGFDGTMAFFTDSVGIPYAFGLAIIAAETLGMLALIVGLFGRYFAASVIIIMVGAIVTMHVQNGFFMNWSGIASGEGYEFHIILITLALATVINGSGVYSLDHYIFGTSPDRPNPSFGNV